MVRRVFVAVPLFVIGIVLIGYGTIMLLSNSLIDHTLENSREIQAAFGSTRTYVDSWIAQHGTLPTEAEFQAWTAQQPERVHSARFMELITGEFPEEAIKKFGPAPAGSYLLSYWRGEWTEYFASWAHKSSLEFDRTRYFAFGSAFADFVVFAGSGAGIFALGLLARNRSPNKSLEPTAGRRDAHI
jgi:hypothetical protein